MTDPAKFKPLDKSVIKIFLADDPDGSLGFFLKFKGPQDKTVKALVCCSHIIDEDSINKEATLKFKYFNDTKQMDLKVTKDRRTVTSSQDEEDTTFIEILEKDGIEDELFLEVDTEYESKGLGCYNGRKINVLHHPEQGDLYVSVGEVLNFEEENSYLLIHDANTFIGNGGAPMIIPETMKVFGVDLCNSNKNEFFGTYIGYMIKKFNEKFK